MDEYTLTPRDRIIIERRAARIPFREIARELNLSHQRVYQLWEVIQDRFPAATPVELKRFREEERELCDDAVADLISRIRDPQTSTGNAVRAWEVAAKWAERKSRLIGLDAPIRREIEVHDTTGWEYQMRLTIAEDERQLQAANAIEGTFTTEDEDES